MMRSAKYLVPLGKGNNLPPNRSRAVKYVIALTQEGVPQPKQDSLWKAQFRNEIGVRPCFPGGACKCH